MSDEPIPLSDRGAVAADAGPEPTAGLDVGRPRALRGPNVWRAAPVITCDVHAGVLDGQPARLAATRARLRAPLPSLPEADGGVAARASGGAWAMLVADAALALQRAAGSEACWRSVAPGSGDGAWALAIAYEEEGVGTASVREAAWLVREALAGDAPDVEGAVRALRGRWEREHLGATATVMVEAARRRGIPVRRAPGDPVVQLGLGCRRRRIDATLTDHTSVIATDITSDKDRTKAVLARLGVPVPVGGVARTVDEAVDVAEDIGFPVIVKPLDGNGGRGISPRCDDAAEVRAAFPRAQAEHPSVVVERFAAGHDHRVLVVNGRVVAVAERVPAHVVGDGVRPIRAIVEQINRDPRRDAHDPEASLAPIPLDAPTAAYLAREGRTLETVPARGETVYLRPTANISTGGTPVDRTDDIHPTNAAICAFAADAVGLDVAGLDVLTPDIAVPFRDNGAVIVEVNASPGIRMHTDPEPGGTARDVPGAILDALFPAGSPTRIPILAVTGTNGKTTTTRLIAHLLRAAGHRVGFTTTDGVYWQEHLLYEGDMTGPMAADMVLSNPRVDAAVLETARGGILRAGLGFDACDVGVVLNVSADHLGIDGIHTVEQLAAVKGVVVGAVRPEGHVVLNADDPLVLAMRERTTAAVVLFSGTPAAEGPAVMRHLAGGGMAATLERMPHETLVLHRGAERIPLLPVADVPLTERGAARFQALNALAASAAAWAAGVPPTAIRAGLSSFTPSLATTPGRMNTVRAGGATIVVDYAHNPAAIRALLDYGRNVPASRRLAVLNAPGDRRDADIREVGALGAGLDRVILKEHPAYRRGRAPGAIAALMREGFLAAGGDPAATEVALDEGEAIAAVQRVLRPGDLVLFVADEAARVVEALEETR